MRGLYFGRDMKELDRRLRWRAENPDYAGKSLQEVIDSMATQDHEIVGTTDMVIEQIKTYEAAGAEELMLQWFDVDDIDGLRTFAKSVLPHV